MPLSTKLVVSGLSRPVFVTAPPKDSKRLFMLAQMPSAPSPEAHTAGAPFGMPHTLAIPDRDPERWQHQLDLLASAGVLIAELQKTPSDPMFPIFDKAKGKLQDLIDRDAERRTQIGGFLSPS